MQSDFHLEIHTTPAATTLALSGELDLLSSPRLRGALADVAGSDAELIIVDLRELEFMDSTGLHLLVQAQQQAQEAGRRFALIRGAEPVQRLFDLTGVAEGLTIVDSPHELFEVDSA